MDSSGRRQTLWIEQAGQPDYPRLERDIEVDVAIVGAGIAGLTTAYLLARQGKRVAVIEDGSIGRGETGRTTAHLSNMLDDRFTRLERLFGRDGAAAAAASHAAAIDRIEAICREEGIDCGFERLDGFLFLGPDQDFGELQEEAAAAARAGVAVSWADRAPFTGVDTGRCLMAAGQAQFHPMRYLAGLAEAVRRHGGQIFTWTHVNGVESEDGRITATTTRGPKVSAGAAVIATNTPVIDRFAMHTKQAPYRTYAIALRVPAGAVRKALYWDMLDPYHYVRLTADEAGGEFLVVGGEDHKTGQFEGEDPHDRFDRLEDWTRIHFPEAAEVAYRWSGQVMEPVDGLAFIGRNPMDEANMFIATGDSGHGMTHGTLAGLILCDLVLDRPNPWAELYDPRRRTVGAAGEWARENLNVGLQYTDLVTGGEVGSVQAIPPGEGAVMREGLKKIAVYRDDQGQLHRLTAVCPHLGCIVQWNGVEKSWDCPCHGSRFEATGRVVSGPSIIDLARLEETGK